MDDPSSKEVKGQQRQQVYAANWEAKTKADPKKASERSARKDASQRARRQREKERKKFEAIMSWFSTPKKTKEELAEECRLEELKIVGTIVDTNKVQAAAGLELAKSQHEFAKSQHEIAKSATKCGKTNHDAMELIKSMRKKYQRTNSESNMDEYEQEGNGFVRSAKKKPALKKQVSAPVLVPPSAVKIDSPAKPRSIRFADEESLSNEEDESETEESFEETSEGKV